MMMWFVLFANLVTSSLVCALYMCMHGVCALYKFGASKYLSVIQFPPEMAENWWRYGGKLVTK